MTENREFWYSLRRQNEENLDSMISLNITTKVEQFKKALADELRSQIDLSPIAFWKVLQGDSVLKGTDSIGPFGSAESPLIVVVPNNKQKSGEQGAVGGAAGEVGDDRNLILLELKAIANQGLATASKLEELSGRSLATERKLEELSGRSLATERKLEELSGRIESLKVDSIPQTPAHYGDEILERAKSSPPILITFEPKTSGTKIFSNVFKMTDEKKLVGAMYKRLAELLKPRWMLSSEEISWLRVKPQHSKHDQKPDLFACHEAFVHFHQDDKDREGVICGYPAHDCLCGDVILIDVKCENTPKALGELAIHLRHLINVNKAFSANGKCILQARGAVAHNGGVRLLRMEGDSPREIMDMNWTDVGSTEVFKAFFASQDETSDVLDAVCSELKVSVLPEDKLKFSCFLGAGATGKVFRVHQKVIKREDVRSLDHQALKIVVGRDNVDRLQYEADILKAIPSGLAVQCVGMEKVQLANGVVGAGLLMRPVGKPIASVTGFAAQKKCLCDALRCLSTIHQAGFVHGDARIQNILLCSEGVMFCDFRECAGAIEGANVYRIRKDIRDLLISSGKVYKGLDFSEDLAMQAAVDAYASDPTEATLDVIVRRVESKQVKN